MRRFWLWSAVLLSCLHSAQAQQAVPDAVMERAWRPPVILAGNGDPQLAVARMYDYAALRDLLVHHIEYHDDTRDFLDQLRASLGRFDLRGFHRLLPEKRSGNERELLLHNVAAGDHYYVGPPRKQPAPGLAGGDTFPLGDMLLRVRSREMSDQPHGTHYLLRGEARLGLGPMRWSSVLAASQDVLRLMGGGDADFERALPEGEYRARVWGMSPTLAAHEVDALAPLWAAYPAIWELAAGLGEIERLVVAGQPGDPDRQVDASVRVNGQRMARHYPALRAYLDRLGTILRLDISIGDEYGEVARILVNSATQRAELTMLLRDGQPVATLNGKPVAGARPHLDGSARRLRVDVDAWIEIYGILAEVTGLRGDIAYQPTPDGALITGQLTDIPAVRTSGKALGIMPAGVINFVLPRSIDQLALDFLTVAAQGNEGEGISGEARFRQPGPGELAELQASGAFEALDNFMVRLGMRIVSDRLIPDEAGMADLTRLISDVQAAFIRDLDRFAARVPGR